MIVRILERELLSTKRGCERICKSNQTDGVCKKRVMKKGRRRCVLPNTVYHYRSSVDVICRNVVGEAVALSVGTPTPVEEDGGRKETWRSFVLKRGCAKKTVDEPICKR